MHTECNNRKTHRIRDAIHTKCSVQQIGVVIA